MRKMFLLFLVFTVSLFSFGEKKIIKAVFSPMPNISEKLLKKVIKNYEKLNNVSVEIEIIEGNYLKILKEKMNRKEPLDMIFMTPLYIKNAIALNWLQPFKEEYLTEIEKMNKLEYFPRDFINKKKIYGYSTGSMGTTLFYNKKLLKKYGIPKPRKMEDMPKILKMSKEKGIIPLVSDTIFLGNDIAVLNEHLKYHLNMEANKIFLHPNEIGYRNRYQAFFSGKVAFISGAIEESNRDDLYRDIFGMIPMEGYSFNLKTLPYAYTIGKHSKNPKEAINLMRFLNEKTKYADMRKIRNDFINGM